MLRPTLRLTQSLRVTKTGLETGINGLYGSSAIVDHLLQASFLNIETRESKAF
jgi:hypothetical protein